MKPTIGRIVIYTLCAADEVDDAGLAGFHNNGATVCPAVVVRVFDDTGKVNLRLLADGPKTPWKTSVEEGTAPGTWHWPPRV